MAQRARDESQLQSDWGGKGNFGAKPGLMLVRIAKIPGMGLTGAASALWEIAGAAPNPPRQPTRGQVLGSIADGI